MSELENMLDELEDTQKGKFLTFVLDKEEYGVEIQYVTEIIGIQAITQIPRLPDYVKGIINLRGKIIPVMDVRLRFGKEPREYNDRTCVIVVDIHNVTIGLIVDAVSEVLSINEEEIVAPPDVTKAFQNKYIKGIGKTASGVKLLLECEKLIGEEESAQLGELK